MFESARELRPEISNKDVHGRIVLQVATMAVIAASLVLSACVTGAPYRVAITADQHPCEAGTALEQTNNIEDSKAPWAKCSLQHHTLSDHVGTDPTLSGYDLAFLEFNDQGGLAQPEEMISLRGLLSSRKSNFVVYFVHGWRHDAALGDPDVGRLRIILAFFRSFMNQRCEQGIHRFCDAPLTGVFVSWPAKEVEETDLPQSLRAVAAGPSFLVVRGKSTEIGVPVVGVISDLQDFVRSTDPDERSIVLAHSAGGNLILTGLKPRVIKAVEQLDSSHLELLGLPIWDKAVLLNPASEAANWIEIQRAVRKQAGTPSGAPGELFRDDQEPLILSYTAACGQAADWGDHPHNECDTATDVFFPLSSEVLLRYPDTQRLTLGHYYDGTFGTTHFVADDSDIAPDVETTYKSSLTTSRCDPAPSWLSITRRLKPHWYWDSFLGTDGNGHRPLHGRDIIYSNGVGVTLARQYGMKGPNFEPITSPNDPFWNIRASGSVIEEHGGYVSYPLLCSIFQAWNDGIAKPESPIAVH